ncbi:molybdopterin cofactor-binding domain-containing protein [uncultured Paracoccus sp.]|uniref:xanthine dehydrogenase family protein molybdopterin-binding subunit n=1 Tax=uncultured Paracoccus sp. TaxID=189685 RepID=UPI0026133F5D|nr:molybdopterin cofactor-binding domain-containing protein [uncultured Paracoccus sp.]
MTVSRRNFLCGSAAIGGAILFPITRAGAVSSEAAATQSTEILSWIAINADGSITFRVPQVELGQAVTTTIPQILAEELDADWETIRVEFYDPRQNRPDGTPYSWTTTLGSSSAHYLFQPAHIAAAQVRDMLLSAAATRLNVSKDQLSTDGNAVSAPSGETIGYAELAPEAANLTHPAPESVTFRAAADRRFVGKPVPRLNVPAITTGKLVYGIDVDLPGMRHAAIRQCPVFGGSLGQVDETPLAGLSGNPILLRLKGGFVGYNSPVPEGQDPDLWAAPVKTDDSVVVVADSWWQAKSAVESLEIDWDTTAHADFSTEALRARLSKLAEGDLPVVLERGDTATALSAAPQRLSAKYVFPYMDPAPLEPLNCTVLVEPGRVSLWTGSQYPDDAHRIAAELTGTPPDQVTLHLMNCGGGFGRGLQNDFVHQAVQIAMTMPGVPVKLLWTREECIQHSSYAPFTVARYEGGLDDRGQIESWSLNIASSRSAEQSYGGTSFPYFFPNMRIGYQRDEWATLPFGWMRGVGMTQHVWMNYGFLGELAAASGRDQLDFYRDLLDPRHIPEVLETRDIAVERAARLRAVLDRAAEASGWGAPKPAGTGRGIVVADSAYYPGYASSTKAAVADVTLGEGTVRVDKVAITINAGTIINPDVVHQQLEGAVIFALNNTFLSEITVEGGQVQQSNFGDYPILLIDRIPQIEITILQGEGDPLGVGEDATPITIAAVLNAIADAGGPRIRSLPVKELELI